MTPKTVPAVDAAPSPQGPMVDPLAKLDQRRRYLLPIARRMAANSATRDVAQRMNNCALRLQLAIELADQGDARALIEGGFFCGARLCPWCEWRRTRAWRGRLIPGLRRFAEVHPTHKAIFATFTVRNCPIGETRAQFEHMHKSWQRLTQCSFFPSKFWLRRSEVTIGRAPRGDDAPRSPALLNCPAADPTQGPGGRGGLDSQKRHHDITMPLYAHPHLHALILVPASYFSTGYVPHAEWVAQWQMAARLDYSPRVDVRRATSKTGSPCLADAAVAATMEAAKYIAKSLDIEALGDKVPEMHDQLRGARMIALSRSLSAFIRDGEITSEEMTDREEIEASDLPLLHCIAQWDSHTSTYQITP
jgi:hypothetical protein